MKLRAIGASVLAPFRPGHDFRPALDEARLLFGPNALVRTFCGPLPWADQTQRSVYDGLPGYLDACRERQLHGLLSYITEAGTGYALDAHVRELEQIVTGRDNVLREVANEADNPSQGGKLTPDRCKDLALRMGGPTAFGACIADDESTTYGRGAGWYGWHRDRGRDKWNQVRRQREGLAVQDVLEIPVLDQEGIGAGEADVAGKRESDPNVFFVQALLARLWLAGAIFHSEDGLWARPLGPNQRLCAEAFRDGFRLVPGEDRYTYQNSNVNGGWNDSPVQSHNLTGCVRAYSAVLGNQGVSIALGITGDHGVRFGAGWRASELADRPGVMVWRVER